MIDVNARLTDAINRYQEANAEIAHASLYLLCTYARDAFPDAKTLEFEWSDQGSFLSLMSYNDGEDTGDLDDESLSWNLGDSNESVWGLYMTNYQARANQFVLNIDDALVKSMAALTNEPPPTDPDAIEEFLTS